MAEVQVPVLHSFRLGVKKPLGSVEPTGRYRPFVLYPEFTSQRQGDICGAGLLASREVCAVRPLKGLDPLVRLRCPPRGVAHRLDVLGSQSVLQLCLLEQLERANPLVPLEGIAGFCQAIADGWAHGWLKG